MFFHGSFRVTALDDEPGTQIVGPISQPAYQPQCMNGRIRQSSEFVGYAAPPD
jgi:hypothetical protein